MDDANNEILKFLPDFCDSLFQVLVSDEEATRETVFNALVHVIRLCEDSENEKFFIEYLERFHSANVFQPLLRILCDSIDVLPSPEGTPEPLVPILRSLKYLTITIIESQKCYNFLTPLESPICINENFVDLFKKLQNLVQDSSKKRVSQNTAIKYIPSMFQPLIESDIFESIYLANYILDILENLSPNVITRERITFLSEIVATDIFADPECVSLLLPKFLDIIIN
uniref:Uncharacterized protein n=1 Tax=Panagrolaimus sp. ES5 TaxID=591445 RepID=A0AC34GG30_9BILA